MVRMLAMLACVAISVLAVAPAQAGTQVDLLGTWPAGERVTLQRNQNFYLHLGYTSDQPVQIWARPYFKGKPARAGSNPSRVYPAGSGEALGWFFLDPGVQVDEVRISAGDGSYLRTPVVAVFPVAVMGGTEPADGSPPPAWIATLNSADKAAQDAAYHRAMSTPPGAGDIAIFSGFMLAMLALGAAGLAWPAWGLWRWRGGWRVAAALPAAVMAFVVLRIVVGTTIDPTSHNLWPFEIVMWGGLSCAGMLPLGIAHKVLATKQR